MWNYGGSYCLCLALLLLSDAGHCAAQAGFTPSSDIEVFEFPEYLVAEGPKLDRSWLEDEEHLFPLDPSNQFDPSLGYFVPRVEEDNAKQSEAEGAEEGRWLCG